MSEQGGDQEGQDQPAEEAKQDAMSKHTPPSKGPPLKALNQNLFKSWWLCVKF